MSSFEEMNGDVRRFIISTQNDELKDHVPVTEIPRCHKCNKPMMAKRPSQMSGLVPRYDYECSECNTYISGGKIKR